MIERRVEQLPVAIERRKRAKPGRPPLVEGELANDVTVRLTAKLEDDAIVMAQRNACYNNSLSAVVRDALARFLKAHPSGILCPEKSDLIASDSE